MCKLLKSMKQKYATILIIIIIFFSCSDLSAQSELNIDSLIKIIELNNENTETADALNQAAKYYFDINIDSAIFYGKKALILSKKTGYKKGMADSYRNIGRANTISGNYMKSFDLFYKALAINERMNDSLSMGKNYASIGIVHFYQEDFDKALSYCKKALKIYKTENYEIGLARIYNNIGLIYSDFNKLDSAEIYYNKTIEFAQKTGDLKIETSALGNIARNYMIKNNFKKAVKILLKIPEKEKLINNKTILSITYANIAIAYLNIGDKEINQNKKNVFYVNSLKYNKMALENAVQLNSNSLRAYAYQGLTDVYKAMHDYKNAFESLEHLSSLNDSIFNQEKTEAIANTEAKYKNEKKQLIIENLQKEKRADEAIIQKKNTIILVIIIGFLAVLVLSLFLYKLYRSKKQALILLDEKNKDILLQKEEIAAQRDKISEIAFELKKTNRTKNKLFSIIAHDLKNPFQGIIGFSEMIKKQAEKKNLEEIAKFSDYIFNVSKQTYKLLDNLLNFTRSQIGLIKYYPEIFSVKKIVEEGILLAQSNAKVKGVKLINEINNTIKVYADESMMNTVFRNLISNAVKFTKKGGFVKVTAETTNNEAVIKIIDNGIGIKETDIPKLFKADLNFSTFGTQNEKGTGLGLVVCKDFIVKNGGTVSVESKVGEGSIFTVILPLKSD